MHFDIDLEFGTPHHPHRNEEHRLQSQCVTWFRYQYPHFRLLLFSVPNGGYRLPKTARDMKAEGMLKGVSDLILLVPNHSYHGLLIEMKTKTGQQRIEQKQFQQAAEAQGYKYTVIRSFDDFMETIKSYINEI